MASIDMTMLGLGLAIVWVGLAAYLLRLGMLAGRLDREVKGLRGALAAERQRAVHGSGPDEGHADDPAESRGDEHPAGPSEGGLGEEE